MRYQTVLFDFDGTIADTGEGIRACAAYSMKKLGYPVPDRTILDRFIGPPLLDSFMKYAGMDHQTALRAVDGYRERYSVTGLFEAALYPGIVQLLRTLRAGGARVAVASGKPTEFLVRVAEKFGIAEYFDVIQGIDLDNHSSDKRAQILSCLPEGFDPASVCMVGDRCYDIDAANALGIPSIGVSYGYGSREELVTSNAGVIIDTVAELTEHLLGGRHPRGTFITFEGSDGCGKSTHMRHAAQWLEKHGFEVVCTREPGGCPISERIREVLLSLDSTGMSAECEALLYAASRVEHVREVILPALEAGKIVLCDRFLDSSIAYQGFGRELGEDFIRLINKQASALVEPDCTLLFEASREEAKQRLNAGAPLDRLEREQEGFFGRVAEGYDRVARLSPNRVRRVNSDRPFDEAYSDTLTILKQILWIKDVE